MFDTICDLIPRDPDYSPRSRALEILRRALNGTLYDVLPYQFHEERGAGGEYIPLRMRRPSVRYALSRVVVEDSVSLLFSEGHFPTVDCADHVVRELLADMVKETQLNQVMTDAAVKGSVGSVAILNRLQRNDAIQRRSRRRRLRRGQVVRKYEDLRAPSRWPSGRNVRQR